MSFPTIVVRNLTHRFPVRRGISEIILRSSGPRWATALDGVDLEIEAGEVFGLLGPNGAGKTTLLKILATLLIPTGGQAFVSGHDVVKAPYRARQGMGYCLDNERSFYYRLTGVENLKFFATLNDLEARRASARVAEALDVVGLNGAARKPFMTYSRGMQQRLGLARALLTDPSVLLLDEPTQGLDPGGALEFRRVIRGTLAEQLGKTILLVTHSLEEARECCDRLAVLDGGKIVFQGDWLALQEQMRAHGFPSRTTEKGT